MNFADAENVAAAMNRLSRTEQRIRDIDELDAAGSSIIPGMIGMESDGYFSPETARKIRAIMRE